MYAQLFYRIRHVNRYIGSKSSSCTIGKREKRTLLRARLQLAVIPLMWYNSKNHMNSCHTHWNVLPRVGLSVDTGGYHPLIVQLLHNRGITEPEQVDLFMKNDDRLEADPALMPDIDRAVNRIYQALMAGDTIAVYGDFDADGVTATAVLVQGLTALGGKVIPYIPHRTYEGYGLRVSAIEKLREQGVRLIITVDTGISAYTEVERAHKMGIEVVVTDHHVPPEKLPPACAVVNPKRTDSQYPYYDLAGVGVAYKLLQALVRGRGRPEIAEGVLDLVALGTVTDMVSLTGENRYWVKRGLEIINRSARLGLQRLIANTRLHQGKLDAQGISWVLGPRINAAGRIDHATTSYQLLMSEDVKEADMLAAMLESKNADRLKQTGELLARADKDIVAAGIEQPILLSAGEDYPAGVMGLVAGRLTDRYYRPVILFRQGKDTCRGSGRSIREFDLMEALDQCRDLLSNYGGHTMAAGFNLSARHLGEFKQRMTELAAEKLTGLDLRPHINIDAEVSLGMFAGEMYAKLQQLAPFGTANPLPCFVSRRVDVLERRQMGGQCEHLRLKLRQDGSTWDAVGFGLGPNFTELTAKVDIVYTLELDRWNGAETLRLNLLDFAPAC